MGHGSRLLERRSNSSTNMTYLGYTNRGKKKKKGCTYVPPLLDKEIFNIPATK